MTEKSGSKGPPAESRFSKGTSGNPAGRPKKVKVEKSGSAFDIIIDKTLTVIRKGVPREVTVEEALQHRTYQDAIAGNRAARRDILKMIAKREKFLAKHRKPKNRSVKSYIEPVDPDNANAALRILGIACRNQSREENDKYERLLLEPWAVQAALGRRRGGNRLTENEVKEINRCTHDAGTIRWPRGTGE